MNILTLKKLLARANMTRVHRVKEGIHGLDADQVLLFRVFRAKDYPRRVQDETARRIDAQGLAPRRQSRGTSDYKDGKGMEDPA